MNICYKDIIIINNIRILRSTSTYTRKIQNFLMIWFEMIHMNQFANVETTCCVMHLNMKPIK